MEKILMLISVVIIFMLGVIHTIYTFSGRKLTPRDENLKSKMENVAPVISGETTMWKCWIGFNASHSFGLLSFGLIYGYLAIYKQEVLFGSIFLLFVGFLLLSGLVVLARLYWFSVPFISACVSLTCYLASIVLWFS
ncbi:hypothetical protein L0152_25750 [bacterium]|nr:hypothetical protein [bacterium]